MAKPMSMPGCAPWWRPCWPILSFYQAVPGLLESLPDRLRREVAAYDEAPYASTLAMMRESLHGWTHDREQVRLGVAPIIPLHCSDELIAGSARLAREFGVVLHGLWRNRRCRRCPPSSATAKR